MRMQISTQISQKSSLINSVDVQALYRKIYQSKVLLIQRAHARSTVINFLYYLSILSMEERGEIP